MSYRPGDFYRISDRSGFKLRASQTVEDWDGLIVGVNEVDGRQPQDFVRGRFDHQAVPDPRPEPTPASIGPLVTNISATDGVDAGQTTLPVESSSGMTANDTLMIVHEGGTLRTTISSIPDSTSLVIAKALPARAPFGASVVDTDVVTTPTGGF